MKSKVIKVLILFIMALYLVGCKKKSNENVELSSQDSSPINTEEGYGILESGNYYQLGNVGDSLIVLDSLYPWTDFAIVQLYDSIRPFSEITSYGKYGGSVTLNNIRLKEYCSPASNNLITYSDTTDAFFNKPLVWLVSGFGSVKAFEYSTNVFPTFDSYKTTFPDEIDISKDIVIKFGSYNADEVVITIGGFNGNKIKTIKYPDNEVTFTKQEVRLQGFGFVELQIVLYKNNFQEINGRVYNFRTRLGILDQSIPLK